MLDVSNLQVSIRSRGAWLPILQDVSLSVRANETLAIVGESGSGKSMLALAIARLLEPAKAFQVSGRIAFEGRDLLTLNAREMSRIRGGGIGIVFQEALGALNPVIRVGDQIEEALRQHHSLDNAKAREAVIGLLGDVGMPSPKARLGDYPHQLSGGMRQRVMIAMVLACEPRLVIADEPTTSLDVTIQAQILSVLHEVREKRHMAMIFISHNLGAVAAMADHVAVMYAGQIVEIGAVETIFSRPRHPYTRALLAAIPRVDRVNELSVIAGTVPRFDAMPAGCRFAPRCTVRAAGCEAPQSLELMEGEHWARCHRIRQLEGSGSP